MNGCWKWFLGQGSIFYYRTITIHIHIFITHIDCKSNPYNFAYCPMKCHCRTMHNYVLSWLRTINIHALHILHCHVINCRHYNKLSWHFVLAIINGRYITQRGTYKSSSDSSRLRKTPKLVIFYKRKEKHSYWPQVLTISCQNDDGTLLIP